jgi:four helix bundle protein
MSEKIQSFRDLKVYQKSFELQQRVFEVTKRFPKEETYSLTDQLRRASRSVGANIAESWQKRRYVAHFVSKLTDSDGELAETQHWIETAFACKYIARETRDNLMTMRCEIGKMLGSMIAAPEKFCRVRD